MRFVCFIVGLWLFGIPSIAQNSLLENKEYEVVISESCKSFNDGGCLVTTFHVLKFEKDSVQVNGYSKADCTPSDRNDGYSQKYVIGKYPYQTHKRKNSPNHLVRINGYSFGLLEVFPNHLIELNPDYTPNDERIFKAIESK